MINPKITVGIPNYNGACYIRLAIESVLSQSYTDFELIITDDGSTDDSVSIIREYENNPHVRIVISDKNHGLSYQLNEQINLARGQYFCRMDADDIMLKDRLKKQFDYLQRNPNVDLVGTAAFVIDNDNQIIGTRLFMANGEYSRQCDGFIHPTVMGKISFFRKSPYSEMFSGVEDTELWLRSQQSSVFRIINEPLLFYRDPHELRVKTYIYRLTLIERLIKALYTEQRISLCSYIYKTARLKYQKIAVRGLDMLGGTSIWVKRRNDKCPVEMFNRYQSILDEQTGTSHSN